MYAGVDMVDTGTKASVSWLGRIKENLQINTLMDKFHLSPSRLIEMALYLGIGFLSAFLLKKYSSYVFVFILFIVTLILLHQFNIITIVVDWAKIQTLFGIQPATVPDANVVLYWEWIKMNFALVLSFSIGFLIGLRVG